MRGRTFSPMCDADELEALPDHVNLAERVLAERVAPGE